jgi:hypothetical protein
MLMLDEMAVVRIPYVNAYADRYGKVRRYFRKPGRKAVPLPGVPGSAEFMAAYQTALGEPAPVSISRQHRPGSVGEVGRRYLFVHGIGSKGSVRTVRGGTRRQLIVCTVRTFVAGRIDFMLRFRLGFGLAIVGRDISRFEILVARGR